MKTGVEPTPLFATVCAARNTHLTGLTSFVDDGGDNGSDESRHEPSDGEDDPRGVNVL